jgi:2-amino-4-hydroxy-6-hydroxymethyldihydropteridine diphosphokinase
MSVRAAIGLGSNIGDRRAHLLDAGRAIADRIGAVVTSSSLYETAPLGGPVQDPYLNGVVVVDTDLAPREVLDTLLAIEREHGRERRERWGPRTLDLDLLLYGHHVVGEPGLTVPHPHMLERRFVLEPLVEAWPNAVLPDGSRVDQHLGGVADQDVTRVSDRLSAPASLAVFVVVGVVAAAMWLVLDLFLR